jgi:hypothetical protein
MEIEIKITIKPSEEQSVPVEGVRIRTIPPEERVTYRVQTRTVPPSERIQFSQGVRTRTIPTNERVGFKQDK